MRAWVLAAVWLVFAGCESPPALDAFVRGPYLQQVTPGSVVVMWRTLAEGPSSLRYGTSTGALDQTVVSTATGRDHRVELTGLQPDTPYFYQVITGSSVPGVSGPHRLRTAPAVGSRLPFRMWLLGDSGTGDENQRAVRDAAVEAWGARQPALMLHVGDLAYNDGTDLEHTTRFFEPYRAILTGTAAYPAIGNHEARNSDSATQSGPYFEAFELPGSAEAGGLPSGTEAYYAFDYANVHFIVLDSHHSDRSVGSAMLRWLEADLRATAQEWIIAYWHHPPYTKGTYDSDHDPENDFRLTDMRQNVLPILEAGGVDLVLTGHSHIYERSFLVDGAYDTPTTAEGHLVDSGDGKLDGDGAYRKPEGGTPRAGSVHVVAGHGGRGVGRKGTHPLMYFTEAVHGSCLLEVNGGRLDLVNVRKDGVQSDHFTLLKGAAAAAGSPWGNVFARPLAPAGSRASLEPGAAPGWPPGSPRLLLIAGMLFLTWGAVGGAWWSRQRRARAS